MHKTEQEMKEWRENWLKGYNEVGNDPEAQREYAINCHHNNLKELVPQAKKNGLTASECTTRLQFLIVTSTIGEYNREMIAASLVGLYGQISNIIISNKN